MPVLARLGRRLGAIRATDGVSRAATRRARLAGCEPVRETVAQLPPSVIVGCAVFGSLKADAQSWTVR